MRINRRSIYAWLQLRGPGWKPSQYGRYLNISLCPRVISILVFLGVNLKGAILEESNMAGVNLRVSTLKNANLQNCILRYYFMILGLNNAR